MTHSRFQLYATLTKGFLQYNLRLPKYSQLCSNILAQENHSPQFHVEQRYGFCSRHSLFHDREFRMVKLQNDKRNAFSKRLRFGSLNLSISCPHLTNKKIKSRYGKALARSSLYRGRRSYEHSSKQEVIGALEGTHYDISGARNNHKSHLQSLSDINEEANSVTHGKCIQPDRSPIDFAQRPSSPEITKQSENTAEQDFFDVKYFGNIPNGSMHSPDVHLDAVPKDLPNLDDKQYELGMTQQHPDLHGNNAHNSDLVIKYPQTDIASSNAEVHDADIFDQFFNNVSSKDNSEEPESTGNIRGEDLENLRRITKSFTEFEREHEVSEELPNLFDKQYFASVVNQLTYQGGTSSDGCDGEANLFDQSYFGSASSSDPSERETIHNFDSNSKRHVVKSEDQPEPEPVNTVKEYVPLSMDTLKSESIFWQEFLQKETRKNAANAAKVAKKSKIDFSPAEKADRISGSSSNTGAGGDSASTMSYSSKDVEISLQDKIRMEAEREILEASLESKILELDLEPTVRRALKGTSKRIPLKKPKTNLELKLVGTPDPDMPVSRHSCSGCGAQMQCQAESGPGYLPSEKFKQMAESNALDDAICQRCWFFVHHKRALNVNVNETDYAKIISAIQSKKAHVMVMVDLLDFPCSIIPNLKDLVGDKTPMFIVGNKFDLIPKDAPNHHKHIEKILLETCIQENVCNRAQVSRVHLISAKTGFGVEKLITLLQHIWGSRKDIYLLGTANIGKSTLFTTLLNSDFSKTKASYLIKQPTISRWPGTTLNLLKFPILRPTKDKVMVRNARLKAEKDDIAQTRPLKAHERQSTVKLSAYWEEKVGRSFSVKVKDGNHELNDEEDVQPHNVGDFADPFNAMSLKSVTDEDEPQPQVKPKKKSLPFSFTPMEFESGKWFYDTPGVLHDRQVLTHLTMDELKVTMAGRVVIPRTLIIKPGQAIFLGGLGRLDYIKGEDSVYFTVFASEEIPVRYCNLEEAEDYYNTHAGESFFKVPIGGPERMKTFPKLLPTDFSVVGCGLDQSASDILLSSAGWVSITARSGKELQLRAFTPNGSGCFQRCPALLPFAVNMKGRRLSKQKPFYKADPKAVLKYR